MSYAHRGSRLMLSGNQVNIPFCSAYFDFTHDDSGVVSGQLITSNSYSIFTIKSFEGVYGGAIAVEMGTTNFQSNNSLSIYNNFSTNNQLLATSLTLSETLYDYNIYRTTYQAMSSNALTDLQTNYGGNHGVELSMGTMLASGNTYMASIYWRANKNDIVVGGTASNIGGWTNVLTESYDNGWNRSIAQWSGNTNGNDSKYWAFKSPSAQLSEVITIDWACPQLEQNLVATSYVSGNRSAGLLRYDNANEMVNRDEGTFSFFLYPTPFTHVIGSTYDDCFDFVTSGGSVNRFLILRKYSTSLTPNQMFIRTATAIPQFNVTIPPNQWTMVTWSWKNGGNYGIYINGVKQYSGAYTRGNDDFDYFKFADVGKISELRIDQRQATDDDILSWYLSGQPFHNPYDGRAWAL